MNIVERKRRRKIGVGRRAELAVGSKEGSGNNMEDFKVAISQKNSWRLGQEGVSLCPPLINHGRLASGNGCCLALRVLFS